jgi:hypothetical protein
MLALMLIQGKFVQNKKKPSRRVEVQLSLFGSLALVFRSLGH